MARGGARPGAGRKPETPNKATAKRQAEVEATGQTPLAFLIETFRDATKEHAVRQDAAKAAAQYVHPKLAAIHTTENKDSTIRDWMIAATEDDE